MPDQKTMSPVERAAAHVAHVKKALDRLIGFKPFNSKGAALAAVRRELVTAEAYLEESKKAEAKAAAQKPAAAAPVKAFRQD